MSLDVIVCLTYFIGTQEVENMYANMFALGNLEKARGYLRSFRKPTAEKPQVRSASRCFQHICTCLSMHCCAPFDQIQLPCKWMRIYFIQLLLAAVGLSSCNSTGLCHRAQVGNQFGAFALGHLAHDLTPGKRS